MANVTITSNTNLDDGIFTALNSHNTITINNGAILTINSDCLGVTSSLGGPQNVQLGSITINDGTVLVDGTQTRIVPFTTHTGSVPWTARGRWQMTASNGVTGEPIAYYFNSASISAGSVKFRSLSGALASGSGLQFKSASISSSCTASSADTTGWLVVSMLETATITTTRQATFKVTGSWYTLGTGSGLSPQYFNGYVGNYINSLIDSKLSPPQGSIPAIWVETVSGSNTYNPWVNLTATGTALNPNATSSLDTTIKDPRGFNFIHLNQSKLITCSFGTDITAQGFVIPTGSRVRVPNVHFIGAVANSKGTSSINATLATWPDFTTTAAGTIDIDGMLGTAFYLSLSQPYNVTLKNSGFQGQLSITEVGNETYIENIGVGRAQGLSTATAVIFTGNYGLTTVKNSTIIGQAPVANSATAGNTFLITSCKNVLITGSNLVAYGATGTTGVGMTINNVAGLDIGDCTICGALSRISQFSSDITLRNNRYINGSTASFLSDQINSPAWDFLQTSNILIDGNQRTFRGGNTAFAALYQFTSCDGIEIKNIGTLEQPFNLGLWNSASLTQSVSPWTAYPFVFVNYNLNTKLSRCYFTQSKTGLMSTNNSNDTVLMQNCMGDSNDQLQLIGRNSFCRGITTGDGRVGYTFGVANGTTLIAGYGIHFYDTFQQGDSKTGSLGILCTEQNPADFYSSGSYTLSGSNSITGSPEFNSNGGVLLRESGSYVIWTWPTFVKGHAGFLNVPIMISGSTQISASRVEYQLDKGSGFSGTWTSASQANLSAETGIDVTVGFKPKIKVTALITEPNIQLTGLTFYTSTSINAQATSSLYPIDTALAELSLTSLITGSEIKVYTSGSGTELASTLSSDDTFSYSYLWEGTDSVVDIVIMAVQYEFIRYSSIILGSTGLTIPIQQRFDRNYSNPV